MVVDTAGEAIHEDGHRREVRTTVRAGNAGLRHASSKVTSRERSLVRLVDELTHVRQTERCEILIRQDVVDHRPRDVGVCLGVDRRDLTECKPDGHDVFTTLRHHLVDVRLPVRGIRRLEEERVLRRITLLNGRLDTCPRRSVEAPVVDAGEVGHEAGLDRVDVHVCRGRGFPCGRRRGFGVAATCSSNQHQGGEQYEYRPPLLQT